MLTCPNILRRYSPALRAVSKDPFLDFSCKVASQIYRRSPFHFLLQTCTNLEQTKFHLRLSTSQLVSTVLSRFGLRKRQGRLFEPEMEIRYLRMSVSLSPIPRLAFDEVVNAR